VIRHVRGSADLRLVPADEHVVLRADQVGLHVVGTHSGRELVRREGVLGPVTGRPAVADDQRRLLTPRGAAWAGAGRVAISAGAAAVRAPKRNTWRRSATVPPRAPRRRPRRLSRRGSRRDQVVRQAKSGWRVRKPSALLSVVRGRTVEVDFLGGLLDVQHDAACRSASRRHLLGRDRRPAPAVAAPAQAAVGRSCPPSASASATATGCCSPSPHGCRDAPPDPGRAGRLRRGAGGGGCRVHCRGPAADRRRGHPGGCGTGWAQPHGATRPSRSTTSARSPWRSTWSTRRPTASMPRWSRSRRRPPGRCGWCWRTAATRSPAPRRLRRGDRPTVTIKDGPARGAVAVPATSENDLAASVQCTGARHGRAGHAGRPGRAAAGGRRHR